MGGRGSECSRDELGREEIGGYGSGEEERRELASEGSQVVRGGMGGRCIMKLAAMDGGAVWFGRPIGTTMGTVKGRRRGNQI